MKKYFKPDCKIMQVRQENNIANLSSWLEEGGQGSEYADAGITTYVIES